MGGLKGVRNRKWTYEYRAYVISLYFDNEKFGNLFIRLQLIILEHFKNIGKLKTKRRIA